MTDIIELLEVKKRITSLILSNTGTYSGTGLSTTNGAINVYLRKKDETSIDKTYNLLTKNNIDEVPMNFIESGHLVSLGCNCTQQLKQSTLEESSQKPYVISGLSRTEYSRPVYGGMSVGEQHVTAGTLGGVVYDAITNEKYLISNNHVFSGSSMVGNTNAIIGDAIYAPGCYDTGTCQSKIGSLHNFIPFNKSEMNFVDCAVAKIENQSDVSNEILDIGIPNG